MKYYDAYPTLAMYGRVRADVALGWFESTSGPKVDVVSTSYKIFTSFSRAKAYSLELLDNDIEELKEKLAKYEKMREELINMTESSCKEVEDPFGGCVW